MHNTHTLKTLVYIRIIKMGVAPYVAVTILNGGLIVDAVSDKDVRINGSCFRNFPPKWRIQ